MLAFSHCAHIHDWELLWILNVSIRYMKVKTKQLIQYNKFYTMLIF